MNRKSSIILTQYKIKNVMLSNRIVMAPMGNHLQGSNGEVTTPLIKYLEERAIGGTGLIITPFASVAPDHPTFGIHSDNLLPGLKKLAETIKKHGAKIFIQIAHLGAMNPNERVAPSCTESPLFWGGVKPEELSINEIAKLRNMFIEAGVRAKKAGFDGVEFHGGYSYLVAEFYSPHLNHRADRYGGCFDNRMRFIDEVVSGIQRKAGEDFPVGFKLNTHEHVQDGIDIKEAIRIAKHLEKIGIAYLHIVSSFPLDENCEFTGLPIMYEDRTELIELASQVKKEVSIPIIAGGGITLPGEAEEIIESGKADLVALGRELIAEPHWVNKVKNNEAVKPCILCNKCHIKEVLQGEEVRCTVNPEAGIEGKIPRFKKDKTMRIAVIGGGPAGLVFSLTGSAMGHEIVLYEKEEDLGGKMALAGILPFKKPVKNYIEYITKEAMSSSSITINTECYIKPEDIKDIDADLIVCAFGAEPLIPGVPGIRVSGKKVSNLKTPGIKLCGINDKENILLATELIQKIKIDTELKNMDNFIVLGAGLVGCEVSWYLAEIGKKVKIFEILGYNYVLSDEHPLIRAYILKRLRELGISMICNRKLTGIEDNRAVFLTESGRKETYDFENFVISTGYKPDNTLFTLIQKAADTRQVFQIGDCYRGFGCFNAIHDAFELALRL